MSQSKQALRERLLDARRSMSESERQEENSSLVAHISSYIHVANPNRVAAYVPGRTEPGGTILLDVLLAEVPHLITPIITEDRQLDWAEYRGRTNLIPGPLGIKEPLGKRLGTSALSDCDLIIVPALACSTSGARLGKGGGYYDRALVGELRGPVAALLFNGEILRDLPVEKHDHPVDLAFTPAGVRNLSQT